MKKLFTISAITVLSLYAFAQAPQKLSYQAVIRSLSGELVAGKSVGMQISILQGSTTGTSVFVERHTTTTNANGLATVQIGGGTIISGIFTTIDQCQFNHLGEQRRCIRSGHKYFYSSRGRDIFF